MRGQQLAMVEDAKHDSSSFASVGVAWLIQYLRFRSKVVQPRLGNLR